MGPLPRGPEGHGLDEAALTLQFEACPEGLAPDPTGADCGWRAFWPNTGFPGRKEGVVVALHGPMRLLPTRRCCSKLDQFKSDSAHSLELVDWVTGDTRAHSPMQMASKPRDMRWHAVSVVPTSQSCEAARALKERRFLSKEAPRLPLANCTHAEVCQCCYRKYSDRRAGPRREEVELGGRRPRDGGSERRAGRGRRSTDA
jgi:hypothetical protein